ncbi:hypothetical protein WA158_005101 [Blastocystis sp. Blastoise]
MDNNFFVTVDAGGTKTHAEAFLFNEISIKSIIKGPGNLAVNYNDAIQNIHDSISELVTSIDNKMKLKFIVIGCAGISVVPNVIDIQDQFSSFFHCSVLIISDILLALYSMVENTSSSAIFSIAGTGSVAMSIKNMKTTTIGGWGHLLGDEGSSYDIVIQFLKHFIYSYDSGNELSTLQKAFMKYVNINTPNDLKKIVYNHSKGDIAQYCKFLSNQSLQGNEESISYFIEAGKCIGSLIYRLYIRENMDSSCYLGVGGSLIENNKYMKSEVERFLLEHGIQQPLNLVNEHITLGGLHFVKCNHPYLLNIL